MSSPGRPKGEYRRAQPEGSPVWPLAYPAQAGTAVAVERAPAAPALIRLRGAAVSFGAVDALRDVHLTLNRGDRLALVGANGSGKTTLLRVLNGLQPHRGERLLAREGSGPVPVSAMVFQRPFLLQLSVRRNLQLALWLAGVPRAERRARIEEALERVGLEDLLERPARALSGGQQQRLALARAWAVRPDILFLDEPTASLDPGAKREVETLIEEFGHHDGMTLVMASHNLGQVKRLCNRVAYLEAGRLRADLAVDDFFFNPAALPVEAAAFLKGELPWH